MKNTYWINWLKAALIRAVKTFAQTMLAFIVTGAAISDIEWKTVLSVSLLAAFASILTSLVGIPEVDKVYDDPSDIPTK